MTFKTLIGSGSTGLVGFLDTIVVPVIFTLTFLVFVWGIVNYFFIHGSEEAKRVQGREFILWSVIGFVVLFGIWAILNVLLSTLGIAPGS